MMLQNTHDPAVPVEALAIASASTTRPLGLPRPGRRSRPRTGWEPRGGGVCGAPRRSRFREPVRWGSRGARGFIRGARLSSAMRASSVALTALVGLSVVLGVWPGGAAVGQVPAGVPSDPVSLITDQLILPSHATLRPLAPGTLLSITLTLPNPDPSGLSRLLAGLDDPGSPSFRHFLTEPQYVSRFGPALTTVDAVTATLAAAGGTHISVSGARTVVGAVLPASAVQSLFGVRMMTYGNYHGLPLYTAIGSPTLGPALAGRVTGIGGLSDGANPNLALSLHPSSIRPVARHSPADFVLTNTSNELFLGSDYTQAYGATALFPGGTVGANATFPTRVAVATLLTSAYNESSNKNLPGYDPTVVRQYFNDSFPPSWPKPTVQGVPVTVGGIGPPVPGSFGTLNDSSLDEFENSLDLEMAGSLAPGAPLYNFYFAGSLLAGATPTGDLADAFAADFSAALSFNYSPARLGVISGSFGLPDLNDSAWNTDLTEAAATGVTVVMSSGDQGNAPDTLTGRTDGPWPVWPASAAFNTSGAVSVGGVSVELNGVPTSTYNGNELNVSFDSNFTGFSGMSAWWDTLNGPGAYSGTEGGASSVYAEPYWQRHSAAQTAIVNAAVTQKVSSLGRAGPDVAFPANSTVAYVWANASEGVYFAQLEGTSVAAPLFAGLLADVIAVENRSGPAFGLGFLDPELYRMGSYFSQNPGPSAPFYDVTVGQNYVFSAAPGWDATTGWGGFAAPLFLAADQNGLVQSFNYSGPSPGLPTPSTPTVPLVTIYVVVALVIVLALVLAVIVGRASRRSGPPPLAPGYGPPGSAYGIPSPAPPGAYGLPPPAAATLGQTTATFLCPYCGSPRPAEPVRCPRCGAL
jgi:subtilase family serine protease